MVLERQKIWRTILLKIAHRGNYSGAKPELENSPDYLLKAIDAGFNVEIDVWVMDDQIWFGHDEPKYGPINQDFLDQIADVSWFHCKNFDSLVWFSSRFSSAKYFWHEDDSYTLTSNGYVWTYPGMQTFKKSIVVAESYKNLISLNIFGACMDDFGDSNV
jgi:hypothetical protein